MIIAYQRAQYLQLSRTLLLANINNLMVNGSVYSSQYNNVGIYIKADDLLDPLVALVFSYQNIANRVVANI